MTENKIKFKSLFYYNLVVILTLSQYYRRGKKYQKLLLLSYLPIKLYPFKHT